MKIILMGSKRLCLKIAQSYSFDALITFDDTEDSRSVLSELKALGFPTHVAKDREDSERILDALNPQICFVAGWYWLLPKTLSEKITFVGVHNSLLPKYRGWAPVVWAMINGEISSGVSLFKIGDGMDEGPIYDSRKVEIGPEEYIDSVLEKMQDAALSLFMLNFPYIVSGQTEPQPQIGEPSYGMRRTERNGMIDWDQPATKVFDFIRAQSRPYPGAFFQDEDKEVIVWRASILPLKCYGKAGTITTMKGKKIAICGDSLTLSLDEVEER